MRVPVLQSINQYVVYDKESNTYVEHSQLGSVPLTYNIASPVDGGIFVVTTSTDGNTTHIQKVTKTDFGNDYMPNNQRVSVPVIKPRRKRRAISI